MAYLSLDNIIDECIREHARVATVARGHTMDNKATIYRESFGAMNNWIESRLCKKKGAELPNLGTFSWEIKHSGDGRTFSRPIFLLNESFVKDHKVKRQRTHTTPNIVKGEEINYSKLAIKFSKNLTKDMIFSGSRDILKKIGDYVDKNYEFEVEFSFGTLRCKERKVRFDFNQGRLSAILPENLRIGTLPQDDAIEDGTGMYDTDVDTTKSIISRNQDSARSDASPRPQITSQFAATTQIPRLSLNGNKATGMVSREQPPKKSCPTISNYR